MFLYAFLIFCTIFMGFMFFLIKTAPYGYEDEKGIHFFQQVEEMDNYISAVEDHKENLAAARK
jgi:hypothetical protein